MCRFTFIAPLSTMHGLEAIKRKASRAGRLCLLQGPGPCFALIAVPWFEVAMRIRPPPQKREMTGMKMLSRAEVSPAILMQAQPPPLEGVFAVNPEPLDADPAPEPVEEKPDVKPPQPVSKWTLGGYDEPADDKWVF